MEQPGMFEIEKLRNERLLNELAILDESYNLYDTANSEAIKHAIKNNKSLLKIIWHLNNEMQDMEKEIMLFRNSYQEKLCKYNNKLVKISDYNK